MPTPTLYVLPIKPVPVLPQELIDSIIDHFDGDFSTLKLLTTVSRCTLARSQAIIFSRIVLCWKCPLRTGVDNTCRTFYELLKKSPRLAGLVKELVVEDYVNGWDIPSINPGEGDAESMWWDAMNLGWIYRERTLPSILNSLSNLEKVELKSVGVQFQFQCFSVELKKAFERVLSPVISLEVDSIMDDQSVKELLRMLSGCQSLRHLSLNKAVQRDFGIATVAGSRVQKRKQRSPRLTLESLELGYSNAPLARLILDAQAEVDVICLRALTLNLCRTSFEDESLRALWKKAAGTLEEVDLLTRFLHKDNFPSSFDPSILRSLPRLKSFTLRIDVGASIGLGVTFKPLTRILDATSRNLRRLYVIIELPYCHVHEVFGTNAADWNELNGRLKASCEDTGQIHAERKVLFMIHGVSEKMSKAVEDHVGCGVTTLDKFGTLKICVGV